MSYGADFATADPANAPLDAPILLGADPVLWGAGLLFLLAALLVGYVIGSRSRGREGDATGAIWQAIDEAAKDAMKANDHALKGRAAHLADVVDRRLGRTLALAAGPHGLEAPVARLKAALDGRRSEVHGDHAHDDHGGHDDHDHSGHGATGHHGADHGAPAAPTAAASTGSVTIVNVIPGAAPVTERPKAGEHHPPRKELTAREQTAELRLAVAAVNEHWRDEGDRTRAMRAALVELSGQGGGGARRGRPNLSHG